MTSSFSSTHLFSVTASVTNDRIAVYRRPEGTGTTGYKATFAVLPYFPQTNSKKSCFYLFGMGYRNISIKFIKVFFGPEPVPWYF